MAHFCGRLHLSNKINSFLLPFSRRKVVISSNLTARNYFSNSDDFIEISSSSLTQSLKLHPIWLRDHCRCLECYNSVTCQRSNDILKFNHESTDILNCRQEGDVVNIEWADGHKSVFSMNWLQKNTFEGRKYQETTYPQPVLWNNEIVGQLNLKPILCDDLKHGEILREVYSRVIRYGFAKIEQVPPTADDTRNVLEQICRLSTTFFGTFWKTGTNFDHNDTGYLNGYLEAHTDTTYFTESQGYLAFHVTQVPEKGGESLLVDGFSVANQLKQLDPEAYSYLSDTHFPSEYIEPGQHFVGWGPCFRHHPASGELEQFRFNLLDRAPLSNLPQTEVGTYYKHLQQLTALIKKKENEYWFRLNPGTVLIFDNWRLMHGRAAFQGKRVLRGCYYTRSDFMSRVRHLGIV